MTDDPLISAITIDTLAIDPNDHNTIYAGTGDLNFGSFSMGSQGILKSTDAGATWTVLGADVFGPAYTEPPGQFPQYDAVGKVRVDPNNSSKVVAGTKKGVFISYNGGVDWTGPCTTNGFSDQRQDVTGLELSDMGSGVTRIIAAVGVRGFATTVQYDLGHQRRERPLRREHARERLPDVHVDRVERERVRLRQRGLRQPVRDRREHERGQRRPLRQSNDRRPARQDRHRGRAERSERDLCPGAVDRTEHAATAAARPAASSGSGRRRTAARPGRTWPARRVRPWAVCGSDYAQNWYDQGLAVDPNNADRLFVDTYDVWLATRTGSSFTDVTCGYGGGTSVHVDQHALAFVNGSSSMLIVGSDGGAFATTQADLNPPSPDQFLQHGQRPEHDRVLLGRHQRELRDLAESVSRRWRTGQRAQRGRLHGLPDRPRAMADDDRRRRLLRAHRPGRHRDRARATSSGTTAAACRAASATA